MVDQLRSISVTVEEPRPGAFHWVLLEASEDASVWTLLESAERPFKKYHQAMAAGLVALQGMIENLDVGPREAGEDEDADPVGRKVTGPFGFGDLPL
ncbi:hypothetical protein J7E70_25110 [Variovorax paradoxus]|nr:hypothetical protein [Variovorax paradoxus]MBT2303730.1 hypothetical protein [Variovorax paradoxus]